MSLTVSGQAGAEGRRVGGVPGEPCPEGKCSQILLLIPFKPKELCEGPRKGLSDWPGLDRWDDKKGEACGLIGGEGDGEPKGAELLKEPGILTGAELWS